MKVNIIGKGNTWVDAPLDEHSWGITQIYLRRPVNLVIDMNVYDDLRWGVQEKIEAERTRLKCLQNGVPYIDLKNYPIKEVIEKFDTDYFGSTVDYAIALALYQGYKDIHLYGITLSITDYSKLKASCDFWCGYVKGLGNKITVHGRSNVMKTQDHKVYGYDREQK